MTMLKRTFVVLGSIGLVACATTTYESSWRAPDAQPIGSLKGQKVIGMVVTKNTAARRSAEDALAAAITAQGGQGVPGYTIASDDIVTNEARVRTAVEASGAAGVVVMRPVAKDKTITSTPSMYTGPMYGPVPGAATTGTAGAAPGGRARTSARTPS